jgi:hypothetical protein
MDNLSYKIITALRQKKETERLTLAVAKYLRDIPDIASQLNGHYWQIYLWLHHFRKQNKPYRKLTIKRFHEVLPVNFKKKHKLPITQDLFEAMLTILKAEPKSQLLAKCQAPKIGQ